MQAKKKNVRNKRSKNSQLRSKVILVIVTVIATVVIGKIFDHIWLQYTSPHVTAKVAAFQHSIIRRDRDRAIYFIHYYHDYIANAAWYNLVWAVPPDTDAYFYANDQTYKIMLVNGGGSMANNIKFVLFKPSQVTMNVYVPKIVNSAIKEIMDIEGDAEIGKEVYINELGKQETVVITVSLESEEALPDSLYSLNGYILFEGKHVEWEYTSIQACEAIEMELIESIPSGSGYMLLKDNPRYPDVIPTLIFNAAECLTEDEIFIQMESKKYEWEE